MNQTTNPTDPDLDLNQRGVVLLSRRSAALAKSAIRAKIEEVTGWLSTYDPPGQPFRNHHSKYSQKIENQRGLLHELGETLAALEAWVSLDRLKGGGKSK